ncbi:hypothetical protein ERJ75_001209400 [Trypanosoma vivax]|nr:hypothetical protein ERJ75_001209400 [Trypanosoma vivax]
MSLRVLDLNGSAIDGASVQSVCRCNSLVALFLQSCEAHVDLSELVNIQTLEELDMRYTRNFTVCVAKLLCLPHLRVLHTQYRSLSFRGMFEQSSVSNVLAPHADYGLHLHLQRSDWTAGMRALEDPDLDGTELKSEVEVDNQISKSPSFAPSRNKR